MLNLHMVPLMLNVKQGSCEYQFLKSFGMARQGNEPRSTDYKEDALTTTPSLLNQAFTNIDKQKNDRSEQYKYLFY